MNGLNRRASIDKSARWKAYLKYKDSGVEWIGEVPGHWEIRKLKYLAKVKFSNVNKHSVEGEEIIRLCNYVDVYHNEFISNEHNFMNATASRSDIEKFTLHAGDVIITKDSEDWEDIAVPAYVPKDMPGVLCGYHLAKIQPESKYIDGEYLFRAFSSRGINDQFRINANGITRYGLGKYNIDNGLFLVPPKDEQKSIANFLYQKTNLIDTLIEKKQKQIELLKEKRSALISHTVTKGLDPDVTMKDSGVEWIGEVPGHWEIHRLKFAAKIIMGQSIKSDSYTSNDGRIPFLQGNAEFGHKHPSPKYFCDNAVKISPIGSILISVRAPVGALNIADLSYGIGRGLCAIVTNKEYLLSEFSFYALTLTRTELLSIATGSTYEAVSTDEVASMKFILPPLTEQQSIVTFLDKKTSTIDTLTSKIEKSITLLKEYRTALISAAVTGKINLTDRDHNGHNAPAGPQLL